MNARARLVLSNLRGGELPPIDYSALAAALPAIIASETYQNCSRRSLRRRRIRSAAGAFPSFGRISYLMLWI